MVHLREDIKKAKRALSWKAGIDSFRSAFTEACGGNTKHLEKILINGVRATDKDLNAHLSGADWMAINDVCKKIKDELSDKAVLRFYRDALLDAVTDKNRADIDRFIKIGVDLEHYTFSEDLTAVHIAARAGDTETVEKLADLRHAKLDVSAYGLVESNSTPLSDAIGSGHVDTARALLRRDAPLNARLALAQLGLVTDKKLWAGPAPGNANAMMKMIEEERPGILAAAKRGSSPRRPGAPTA